MLEIGKLNNLRIDHLASVGAYLDGGTVGEVLLPAKYVTDEMVTDVLVDVFIYRDSEDRLVAVTDKPFTMVGEFAYLQVRSVNQMGAFLDWGLPKDLLVPFSEQRQKMEEGRKYMVYTYLDSDTNRLVASSKLDRYLDNVPPGYTEGQKVELFIAEQSELGYKAIINSLHWGLLYKNEVFTKLHIGEKVDGYIGKVREDEKIDVCLEKPGYGKVDGISENILLRLKMNDGFIPLSDKSPAEAIYSQFGMSKKNFKKAIGSLYKQRLIVIEENGIRLI